MLCFCAQVYNNSNYALDHNNVSGSPWGILSPEKGTDCGLTAEEWWLSRPKIAKKKGAVLLLYCMIGELSEYLQQIFYII